MNSRNQNQNNNQIQKRMHFRNKNSPAAGPGHFNSSRRMLDDFEAGQRIERRQPKSHFPPNQEWDNSREQLGIARDRSHAMDQRRGPAPGAFFPQDNISNRTEQTNFQPIRRPYNNSPAGGQRFVDNNQQEYNHSPARESSLFRRRSDNSPQQEPYTKPRERSRSPARDLERMSPRRSPRRGRQEDYSRLSREPPGGSHRPKVGPEQSGFKNKWEPDATPDGHSNSNPEDSLQQNELAAKINSHRKNLCGSRTKWYLRYLKQGFSRDEAYSMAKEPIQPAANYRPELSGQRGKPNPAMRRLNPSHDRKPTPVMRRPSPSRELRRPSPSRELRRPSPGLNRHSPERKIRKPSWDDDDPGPSNESGIDEDRVKICLMPLGYPREKLSHQEKLDLEEAITIEVASSSLGIPLRFTSVAFRTGYLEVECFNKFTADWLMRTGSQLPAYRGHPVETKINLQKKEHLITVSLPRSSGKSDEFLLQLLKSQNTHNIDLWTVVSRTDSEGGDAVVVFSIDDASAAEIACNGHTIFYRMSRIRVEGLQQVDIDEGLSTRAAPMHANDHSPAFNRNRGGKFVQNY